VLSYGGWKRQFGGDPRVIGRHFQLTRTGTDVAIVGVMPQGLDYPRGTDFWTPIVPATSAPGSDHPFREVDVVGRLATGASMTIARDELTAFFSRDGAPPIQHGVHGVIQTLPELMVGDAKPAVLIFAAAAALLLLITCINVANLLLIRGVGRVREIAVRIALGASRGRIARQLLTESAVVAMAGSLVGTALAAASLRAFIALAPADVPRLDEIHVGAATLGDAALIGIIATVLVGVAPALIATRRDVEAALRSGSRQSASRTVRRATEALVVGQVALALMILSSAGVVARSLFALEHVTLAYDSSNLLLADLTLRRGQFDGRERQIALLERLLPRIATIPGVAAVTPVGNIPFSGAGIDGLPMLEGQTQRDAAKNPFVNMEAVAPNYFTALGIPLIEGRGFTNVDRPNAPLVLIVNQSLARRFWPGESAIGKRFATDTLRTVVGVVPDVRYRDLRTARPTMYLPLAQSPFPFAPMTLAIRTRAPSAWIVAALRARISEVDAGVGLAAVHTFDELLDRPLAHPRLNAGLLVMFAAAALALATVGLFGVMTAMVRQRTSELGIRMALGATGSDIGRLVAGRGVRLTAIGVVAGIAGALATNNFVAEILYDVAPTDAASLAAATIALVVLASLATVLPAAASARTDPLVALRTQD
jgi:predicted permease